VWSFSTIGGVKRVNIESASDLLHLSELDPKLWTALSCPVNDLEIDKRTLQLVDTDNDGHIRVPEVIAAVDWMNSVLKDPAEMLKHQTLFPLSAINDATDEGKGLLESAKVILRNLGKENEEKLTVEETSDTERIFAGTAFNGDGVITEDSVKDATLVQLLGDIMTCIGSATDRGAKQGVTAELIQLFLTSAKNMMAGI
jgi:Ca2+-binding EF-hand superfamily protein